MPRHKYINTGPKCYSMQYSSHDSSSKCGHYSNQCTCINNTGNLSTIFCHSDKQSGSEYPSPDTASGCNFHTVHAAGSDRNWLTTYGCNWHLEAYNPRHQVSICIHRHMDNKIISMVRHDNRGKSLFNRWNECNVSIHMHLETTVYRNINFD